METSRLSAYYLIACDRVHQVVDELYENLHNEKGEPIQISEAVIDIVAKSRKEIYEELDMIKSIVAEYEALQSRGNNGDDPKG